MASFSSPKATNAPSPSPLPAGEKDGVRGDCVLHLKEVNVFALGIRFSPGLKVQAILTPTHTLPHQKGEGIIGKNSKMFA